MHHTTGGDSAQSAAWRRRARRIAGKVCTKCQENPVHQAIAQDLKEFLPALQPRLN